MKILYIITGFGMKVSIGGAARRVIEVARRYILLGHQIHFLTTQAGKEVISKYNFNCHFHMVKSTHVRRDEKTRLDRFLSYIISTIDFFTKVKKLPKFDVVISSDDWFCETIPAFIYKCLNPDSKWIAYAHEPPILIWVYRFWRARQKRHYIPWRDILFHLFYFPFQEISFLLYKLASDKILPIGSESSLFQKYLNFSPTRVACTENGVDFKEAEKVLVSQKIYDGCFLGGFRPSKGIFDLPHIWRKVVDKKPDANLIVIGSGSTLVEKKLRKMIREKGLENNIQILGQINDKMQLFKLLKASRVFVFPSHKEGWAIPITEAMACGLPVIVWEYPFYLLVYSKGISYVPLGDFSSFSNSILNFLTNEDLWRRVSKDAHDAVKRYDWDEVAKKEIEIIGSVVKGEKIKVR